jgi:type II secretory pathway pseudopilin PulG
MVALVVISVLFVAGTFAISFHFERRERERQAARAQARARYQRERAEFLANATPAEAHEFLIHEQTEALVAAQQRTANLLFLSGWLNGTNNPFQSR